MTLSLNHFSSLILMAGLSGAGKTSALNFLSDLGYYAIDNLPLALLPNLIELSRQDPTRYSRTVLLLGMQSQENAAELEAFLGGIDRSKKNVELVFLDCRKDVVIRRYSETRRPHPTFDPQTDRTLSDAIDRESLYVFPFKSAANFVLDTSEMNVHDLKRALKAFVDTLAPDTNRSVRVNFVSFGFKFGTPSDCDIIMDVRFLPNPHFVASLREKTGLEPEVANYVMSTAPAQDFVKNFSALLRSLIPQYAFEGKSYLNIGIGCTGGRHRSIAVAEALAATIDRDTCLVSICHRDKAR